ncbi:MAG: hypothetical protein QGG89_16190, partial [Vicinamibacterales bacterium]|nr:hypothetical protein [Vicinamibacterales bacterium]
MRRALRRLDFVDAALEMLDSKSAGQVGKKTAPASLAPRAHDADERLGGLVRSSPGRGNQTASL